MESQLKIGNKRSKIIDPLFPTFYSKTKHPYRGIWSMRDKCQTPQIKWRFIKKSSTWKLQQWM